MLTKSKKAKGRRLQNSVVADIRRIIKTYFPDIEDGDVVPAVMGQAGLDVVLSPRARDILNVSVECKNNEALNIHSAFEKHYNKYKGNKSLKLLVHSKNRSEPQVTMHWKDLVMLFDFIISCLPAFSMTPGCDEKEEIQK